MAENKTLKVPGATLYYQVRGSGPVLLMIPGGPTDAAIFAGVVPHLTDRYTVVAYDPRGNSRSVLDGPAEDVHADVHGDDAHRLLAELGDEPAYVFGSSGGAVIGLNLAARYPGQVRTLVAHEPPCGRILPDAEEYLAGTEEVYQAYRTGGVEAGMKRFEEFVGLSGEEQEQPQTPPSPEMMEGWGRIGGNLDFFLGHVLRPVSGHLPDVAALRQGPARIVVGVGDASTDRQYAYRSAVALAEALGRPPAVFPGDHGGFVARAEEFAVTLDKVLNAT
ncbi:pimeloyl-ACP methyl ester carboxylesterase [Nonomuraea muscovyensis]|uniref:Pimeloyl-ACP methyl ester carboxylesterase n=1 Tax=Nonomuraea muscovyensis TaxID=1124761 RepID=A0A7X0C3U1_9ACTN|nr:alpha/beta fold hydrolase [Nonomuraea muscovyensis]MBB6346935.1 pimeloyl-ACP methyl ester carboxylesterase [Nonomuraea muscovyensis]